MTDGSSKDTWVPEFMQKVAGVFVDALEWLVTTFDDPTVSAAIREDLGLAKGTAPPPPVDDQRLAGIRAFTDKVDPDAESFGQAVEDIVAVTAALGGWIDAIRSDDESETGEILYLLLAMGVTEKMRIKAPALWGIAELLTVLHDVFGAAPGADEGALGTILSPLWDLLKLVTGQADLPGEGDVVLTEEYATLVSNLFSIAFILTAHKVLDGFVEASYGWDHPVPGSLTPEADARSQRALTVSFGELSDPDGERGHLTMVLVPDADGGPGIVLSPGGTIVFEKVVPRPPRQPVKPGEEVPALAYRAEVVAAGGLSLFIPFVSGIGGVEAGGGLEAALKLGVTPVLAKLPDAPDGEVVTRPAPPTVPAFRIGLVGKTRIEIGSFGGGFEFGADRARAELVLRDIDLVTQLGDGDNFLATQGDRKVLFGFDLTVIADTAGGISFGGGSGLHVGIPVSRSLWGVFVLHHVEVQILPSDERDAVLLVTGAFTLRLGPFSLTVEGIGLRFDLAFTAGNLGIVDVDADFEPPKGIGLALAVGSVKGGGFLYFDKVKGEYAGVLEIKIKSVTLKAIGILTTKPPGGAEDYSLLIVLFGEFSTPLGWGFYLTGAGGMIGIRHGVNGEALRGGLKTGVLDDILFPKDPVANAPRILNQMRTIFPITPRTFTFGPFLRISYGKVPIIHIQLGLIFELQNVSETAERDLDLTRIVLVGQVKVEMPPSEVRPKGTPAKLILIVDIVGELDLQKKFLAIDARLRDSKLSGITLTGSLVVRVNWGEERSWIAAAGGFHPKFTDLPANLPKQDRLGVSLKKGIATIKAELYIAVTSNTFQIGGRLFVQAKKWGFSVEGYLVLDTLWQFKPFRFTIDIEAGVVLKRGSNTLMGIDLKFSLAGPGLWRAQGSAKFKILFLSKTVKFDEEWGDEPETSVLVRDAQVEIEQALSRPENWAAALPGGGEMLVSLRPPDDADLVPAHPLGELVGRQAIAPLETDVDMIDGAEPAGARRFSVTEVTLGGGGSVARDYVTDHFARAQYVTMSDDEKLAAEAFERLPAGVAVAADAVTVPSHLSATLDFETIYLPSGASDAPVPLADGIVVLQAALGAAALSELRPHRFLGGAARAQVTVADPPLVAVGADDLAVVGAAARSTGRDLLLMEDWELEGADP